MDHVIDQAQPQEPDVIIAININKRCAAKLSSLLLISIRNPTVPDIPLY
jgi:hypothetical protein